MKILFLGKENDEHVKKALEFCQSNFDDVRFYLGKWGEKLPKELDAWEGDYIISYLSRWIIPERILIKAKMAAINFHPASPDYPGFGCNNFALYEDAKEYGATCHHMQPHVDTGAIIAVKRFPVFSTDTVATLLSRTYTHQLSLFYDIASYMIGEKDLPISSEKWSRTPFSRKDFNALERITPDMSKEEIMRRIRATTFDKWAPIVELHGLVFELKQGV